ncbi:YfbM family protein [Streptomyces sp. NPDC059575]|uniref:YfbM family protein n=1 Tax=Streptomyces sp. NPDC059575 TaxID=3346872 RepID=UPI0036AACCC3
MGIHCVYVRLTPAELQRASSDPSWAQERIDELGDAWAEEDPLPPEKAPYFSIEKSWHKLHYLMAAHRGIPVDVIHGGVELPLEDDMDYGPARYLSSGDVARASDFLATTPFGELARHYDLAAMRSAEIYLVPDSEAEVPSDLDALRHRYEELSRFFSAAATAGDVVVLMLA